MKSQNNLSLASKIKAVLKDYFKTQFVLIIITILLVSGIMFLVPEYHIVIEILIASIIFLVLSQVMDYIVSPYFLSKSTKVSPLLLVFSFVIGVMFMGILGALVAVPVALVIKTVWEHNKKS